MNENEMKNATIADIDEVTTPVAAAEDAAAPIQEPAAQDETNTAEVENLAPEAVSAPADDGMDEEDEDVPLLRNCPAAPAVSTTKTWKSAISSMTATTC